MPTNPSPTPPAILVEKLRSPDQWLCDTRKTDDGSRKQLVDATPFEAADLIESLSQSLDALQARVEGMEEALKPFAQITPSSLYPEDGSEGEEYVVLLRDKWGNPASFTGADLRRARAALSPQDRVRAAMGGETCGRCGSTDFETDDDERRCMACGHQWFKTTIREG